MPNAALELLVQIEACGARGRRAPGCRRAPQAPVVGGAKPLSRCAVTMRPSAPVPLARIARGR